MTEIIWIYGSSGVGKTKHVVDEAKKYKDDEISIVEHVRGNYVEGFMIGRETKVIIIDNYSEEMMSIDKLIKLFDNGTYRVKGHGIVEFKPEIVYITCLYEPDRCLQVYNARKLTKHQLQKIEELKERITTIVHLTA